MEEERLAAQMEREAMKDGEEDYEDEGEEEEEEEEEGEEEGKVLVVKNSPSNYSAMSYEMFVGAQKAGELQDDNKDLSSLAGSFAASSSNNQSYMSNNQLQQVANNQDNHSHNSTQRGEDEERASVRTNSSSLGPRKVRREKKMDGKWKWRQIGGANSITAVCRLTSSR